MDRRSFVRHGAIGITAFAAPRQIPFAKFLAEEERADAQGLAQIAVETARNAGAAYADVSIRFAKRESWQWWSETKYPVPVETFTVAAGVRALCNGRWGFAGFDGISGSGDMARLAKDAVIQARNSDVAGASAKRRAVELAPVAKVAAGVWATPIEIDPFTVSNDEKIDFICAVMDYISRERVQVAFPGAGLFFTRDENTFASTEGASYKQTSYNTGCNLYVTVENHFRNEERGSSRARFITQAGAGWEYIIKTPFQDKISQLIDEASRSRYGKPVDIGRYDIVFDAYSMASMIDATIRPATELDRVSGYKANDEGTSFLSSPLEMLGAYKIGSHLVNITANRSMPGGAATVKWDDEGVEPLDINLVKDGVLMDFQTTRESASWLASHYNKIGLPVRSSGCSGREKASIPQTQCSPNIVMEPSKDEADFQDLVSDTKRGFAVIGSPAWSDQQALNGYGTYGLVYEIRNGKLGESILNSSFLYRTPEFWRNVVGIGGSATQETFGMSQGTFGDAMSHTVAAIPAKIAGVAMTDSRRKA